MAFTFDTISGSYLKVRMRVARSLERFIRIHYYCAAIMTKSTGRPKKNDITITSMNAANRCAARSTRKPGISDKKVLSKSSILFFLLRLFPEVEHFVVRLLDYAVDVEEEILKYLFVLLIVFRVAGELELDDLGEGDEECL